jgi:hypothetical protein
VDERVGRGRRQPRLGRSDTKAAERAWSDREQAAGEAGRGGNGEVVRGSVDLWRKRVEQAGGGEMGEDNRQIE